MTLREKLVHSGRVVRDRWKLFKYNNHLRARAAHNYINELPRNTKILYLTCNDKYAINGKITESVFLLVNVCATGIVLSYIFTHKNFLSYGLSAAVICYYFEWFRQTWVKHTPRKT